MLSHHKALPSAWLCDPGWVGILAGTHPNTVHCVVWSGLVFLSPSAITGSQPGKSQPEVILHSWMPHLRARLLLVTFFIRVSSASGLLLPASSSRVILTELSSLFQTLSSRSSSSLPPLLDSHSLQRSFLQLHSPQGEAAQTSGNLTQKGLDSSVPRPPLLGPKGPRRHQNSTASAQGSRERRRETWSLQERAAITHQRETRKGIGQTAGGPSKLTQPKSAPNLIRDENERQ